MSPARLDWTRASLVARNIHAGSLVNVTRNQETYPEPYGFKRRSHNSKPPKRMKPTNKPKPVLPNGRPWPSEEEIKLMTQEEAMKLLFSGIRIRVRTTYRTKNIFW